MKGFICEGYALEDATDISQFGGWREFIKSKEPSNTKFKCEYIGKSHNDEKISLAVSICGAVLFSGCDNTAKIPASNTKASENTQNQPIRIGYSDWPGFVARQVAIEKAGLKKQVSMPILSGLIILLHSLHLQPISWMP